MSYVTIGHDVDSGEEITIGDIERRSGFYILGKPGMGKSALMVNLMNQDTKNGHGVFFLDPHADAINDLLSRGNYDKLLAAHLFNLEDETYSFGINLLSCRDVHSLKARTETYTRAYNVFYKLWENEWGPWLQLILQNTLWAFIENQEYTLAEVPMFLNPRNTAFRSYILSNITHNPAVVDFWQYEFSAHREGEQQKRIDAALTRVNTLLTLPYIRHIIGQQKTTLDFDLMLNPNNPSIWLFQLSANLPEDIKRFAGTILVSELLHAVRNRPEYKREQFCIFVDEFHNFASSDDFKTLITEARKFGIASTFAHVERFGQFTDNQKLLGATAAAVNKVFFEPTVKDAQELAPEFTNAPPPPEKRWEPELVISQEPLNDLLRRRHANPRIQKLVDRWFLPLQEYIENLRDNIEGVRIERTDLLDQATLFRDQASLYRGDEQIEGLGDKETIHYTERHNALKSAMNAIESAMIFHSQARSQTEEIKVTFKKYQNVRQRLRSINGFLTALMEGNITPVLGQEVYANFFIDVFECGYITVPTLHWKVNLLYLSLRFGNPKTPRTIPAILAMKYWPELLKEAFIQRRRKEAEKWYGQVLEKARTDRETRSDVNYMMKLRRLTTEEEYYTLNIQESLNSSLAHYQQSEIITESGAPAIRGERTKFMGEVIERPLIVLPDLPARVLRADEIEAIKNICYTELFHTQEIDIFETDLIEFCNLLAKPENHIKVYSSQFVAKTGYARPVHDMTDEMVQELIKLPRFTAYAKVIAEKEGAQTVWSGKIHTLPPPPSNERFSEIKLHATESGYTFCKERIQIEEEIRQRQERWRGSISDEPPPTHAK